MRRSPSFQLLREGVVVDIVLSSQPVELSAKKVKLFPTILDFVLKLYIKGTELRFERGRLQRRATLLRETMEQYYFCIIYTFPRFVATDTRSFRLVIFAKHMEVQTAVVGRR